jgi:hypothetical protein
VIDTHTHTYSQDQVTLSEQEWGFIVRAAYTAGIYVCVCVCVCDSYV